jgi:hypothetical protein
MLSDLGHLSESLVREHVCRIPADGTVAEKEFLIETVVEGIVSAISGSCGSSVLEAASGISVERVATSACNIEPALKVFGIGEGILEVDCVTLAAVGIRDSDITVVVSIGTTLLWASSHAGTGVVDRRGHRDGRWDHIDSRRVPLEGSAAFRFETVHSSEREDARECEASKA